MARGKKSTKAKKSARKSPKKAVKKSRKLKKTSPARKKNTSKKSAKKKPAAKRKVKKVAAIPKGYNNITPYLIIDGATSAIEFYKRVFGAKEKLRMEHQPGTIGHAELQIGDTKVMLADECPGSNMYNPKKVGGSPVIIHLYVKDVDDVVERAVDMGAFLRRPAQNMFYGDRSAHIEDPYGHQWCVSTHVEDVSPAQTKKRAEKMFSEKQM